MVHHCDYNVWVKLVKHVSNSDPDTLGISVLLVTKVSCTNLSHSEGGGGGHHKGFISKIHSVSMKMSIHYDFNDQASHSCTS